MLGKLQRVERVTAAFVVGEDKLGDLRARGRRQMCEPWMDCGRSRDIEIVASIVDASVCRCVVKSIGFAKAKVLSREKRIFLEIPELVQVRVQLG